MANATVWTDAVELARRAVSQFELTRRRLIFEPMPRGATKDGICWPAGEPGSSYATIYIRVHRVGKPRQAIQRSTIMAALAHELAHLRHPGHDADHGELTRQIAAWLKEQGEPVSHIIHSGTHRTFLPRHLVPVKRTFKRAWKRPKPRASAT